MSAGGVRLQFAGTAAGHDRVEVEGDPLAGDACALFPARGPARWKISGARTAQSPWGAPRGLSVVDEATGRQIYP